MKAQIAGSTVHTTRNRTSVRRHRFGRLRGKTGLIFGLGFIVLVTGLAIFAPLIAQFDPVAQNYGALKRPPSLVHWLGTDELGRDLFSRIAYGARASMLAGVVSVMIAAGIGIPLGLLAGYVEGPVDTVISRVIDAVLAIPFLVLAIAMAAFLGPGLTNSMIAIGLTAAPIFARLTRGEVLGVKAENYVEAARALGNPHWRITTFHILPNVTLTLVVQATLTLASAILWEAGLSFLGLGQQPPSPSWGSMLNAAQRSLSSAPWIAIWPGMMIFMMVLSFNLVGDGLRDLLAPRGE